MKRPPMVMSIKIGSNEQGSGANFALWIPLFIIGPIALILLLALLLVALPFLFLSFLFTFNWEWWRRLWYWIPAFFDLMHSMVGLNVDIVNKENTVYINVI
jgi:hypothetical protein